MLHGEVEYPREARLSRRGSETDEEAVLRELREEVGLEVEIERRIGEARDHQKRPGEVRVATYFRCRLLGGGPPLEAGHALEWWSPEEARAGLTLASDRWIVGRA